MLDIGRQGCPHYDVATVNQERQQNNGQHRQGLVPELYSGKFRSSSKIQRRHEACFGQGQARSGSLSPQNNCVRRNCHEQRRRILNTLQEGIASRYAVHIIFP